jgi:LPXTG-site transpeptidase (sortase) family protein
MKNSRHGTALAVLAVGACTLGGLLLLKVSPGLAIAPLSSSEREGAVFAVPARITIPSIHVDATVGSVGLTDAGAVGAPTDPMSAGWYEFGPRPGEVGNAVIVGHYGWKDGRAAVFDALHSLHPGDRISVEDASGSTTRFVVRELRVYGEQQDASEVFYPDDTGKHLVLITCEGAWNKASKSYSGRLVVFADIE